MKRKLNTLTGSIIVLFAVLTAISATGSGPAAESSNWFGSTFKKFSSNFNMEAVATEEEAIPESQEWFSFKTAFEKVKGKITDTVNNILPDKQIIEQQFRENLDTLLSNIPDLSLLPFDVKRFRNHGNDWDWDAFIDEMLSSSPVIPSVEEETEEYTNPSPECEMTTPEMIRHAGYRCEVHTVETNDGYILELHRIPFGRDGPRKSNRVRHSKRPVVFFQHGLLADSSCWVANGRNRSLPYVLADAGLDVWLGNVRGSTYSRKHKTLNPNVDEKYWRFSWQHMAQSDLPAMVNKALRESGQRSLYYIGHSQGTLIAFAKLADDPFFNDKIRMFFALGPVSTLGNITSPVRDLIGLGTPVQIGMSMFGGAEILPRHPLSQYISAQLHKLHQTQLNDTFTYHGNNLMLYLTGFRVDHYFTDRLPVYVSHVPAGTSLQNLVHLGQLVESGRMQKWDYLLDSENLEAYGQITPPEYNVSAIQAKIVLYVGSEDVLADPEDNLRLSRKLSHLHHYEVIGGWDHLDFIWGRDAVHTVYAAILRTISEMELSMDSRIQDISD